MRDFFIMVKEKKPVRCIQMTKSKRNIIYQLMEERVIQTAVTILLM